MSIHAVVVGTDHINTLGIVRSLGEAAINVELLILSEKEKKSWVSKSRYVSKTNFSAINEIAMIQALLEIAKDKTEKLYLFPCGDYPSLVMDKNRRQLEKLYYVPGIVSGDTSLDKIMEKSVMVQKAIDAGFKVPKTILCDFSLRNKDYVDDYCTFFSGKYPLLIRSSGSDSHFSGFKIVENEEAFVSFLGEAKEGKAIIQEFIDKDEEIGIQGVGFGNFDIEPVITHVIHKIRTSVVSPGSTTYATIAPVDNSDPVLECKKFIKMNNYSGLFDIELLRKGNTFYFVECNFRNGAYGYAYTCAGHNLPLIWIKRIDDCKVDLKHTFSLMNEFNDIKHIKMKNIGMLTWINQFERSDIRLTFNKYDIRPFIFRLIYH